MRPFCIQCKSCVGFYSFWPTRVASANGPRKNLEAKSSFSCSVWRCKVLPSIMFIAWRVLENRIATTVNLERRGIVVDNLLCCLCGKEEEFNSHLFFAYRFAWLVWCLCFEWLGVVFVTHFDPMLSFIQFGMCNASGWVNDLWGAIWVDVVIEIWKHMNNIIFNRGKADETKVFALVEVKVCSCIYSKSRFRMFFFYWCLDPTTCMAFWNLMWACFY